jgi:hypothetical protein
MVEEREREVFQSGAADPEGRPHAGRRTQLPERESGPLRGDHSRSERESGARVYTLYGLPAGRVYPRGLYFGPSRDLCTYFLRCFHIPAMAPE